MKKLVSRSEFAHMATVSAAAVTKAACTVLKNAVHGKRIDVNHPDAVKYLQSKESPAPGIDPLYAEALKVCQENGRYTMTNIRRNISVGDARAKRIIATIKAAGADKPVIIKKRGWGARNATKKQTALDSLKNAKFADMTLTEVVEIYGTDIAFLDWLKATKLIAEIEEKRLKNAATRGDLINRDLIKTTVIKVFYRAFNILITDGAKTIASRVITMHSAGRPVVYCEEFVSDQISTFIQRAKSETLGEIKNA